MAENHELRTAWDFVENTGRSIFLTGKAGTGKTTFLKTIVEKSRKRPIVVAPTGVAAINAGGVTIHSFFQLPFTPYVPGSKLESKFDFGREKRKIIASIDLLIIDEISMVRADLLDAIDTVLRRFRDHYQPFGGVQLLMIGDLAQLTPVVTAEDEQILKPYYDTPYFFGSKALQQIDYVTIQLDHVYRQQDMSFIDILNQIREGHPTSEVLSVLNNHYKPTFIPKPEEPYIRLTTHNQLANYYNDTELKKLSGRSYLFHAEISGTFPDFSYPTAETLELKQGAQVMFVKNDPSAEHLYYNGRIGRVTYVDAYKILVLCDGDNDAIEVEPLEWENTRYTLNEETREIETEVQGVFKQYPLRLAWAITIHKSQGLTFDRAIIDGRHDPSIVIVEANCPIRQKCGERTSHSAVHLVKAIFSRVLTAHNLHLWNTLYPRFNHLCHIIRHAKSNLFHLLRMFCEMCVDDARFISIETSHKPRIIDYFLTIVMPFSTAIH